jgi:hypothetical protein
VSLLVCRSTVLPSHVKIRILLRSSMHMTNNFFLLSCFLATQMRKRFNNAADDDNDDDMNEDDPLFHVAIEI